MTNKIFKESFAKPIKKIIKESEDVVKKAEKEWSTDIQRADDYWANEVLFQADSLGIELKDGLEREIADKILNDDYIWEQINSKIQELIEEMNESCKKVSEAAGEQEKRTGHTEGNRLPELK